MKQLLRHSLFLYLILTLPLTAGAQLYIDDDDAKSPYILASRDTVTLNADRDIASVAVMSNCDYTASTDDSWITCSLQSNGNLLIVTDLNNTDSDRTGFVTLTSSDATFVRLVTVVQNAGGSADDLSAFADIELEISGGSATSVQSGEDFSLSYDGDTETYYHSSWYSTSFPVTLIWTLEESSHIDYLVYTPRQDGSSNGAFGEIEVYYYTISGWTLLGEYDLGETTSASTISFGDDGVDGVSQVKIIVNSAYYNVVSCAEMQFFQTNDAFTEFTSYFQDDLCTELVDGFTEDDLAGISNSYLRSLAAQLLEGTYSMDYRVGEYEPYMTTSTLQSTLKNSNPYSAYENPTGIYFDEDESLGVIVTGIPDGCSVSLIIKCFGNADDGTTAKSTYALSNGFNVITASNRGNSYISYYDDDYEDLPNIQAHFVMGQENGYFDSSTDDNTKWKELLAGAVSDILDIVTPRMQVAALVSSLQSVCKNDGVSLAHIYDGIVYREREIMGLLGDAEPKNHQFAQPVSSGIYADNNGANISYGSFYTWCYPDSSNFDVWGMAHELGHNNQTTGFHWSGCGETTNNVYAVWAQHNLYGGYHRLEDESCSINGGSSVRGGRFNSYLENGVRLGEVWQRQEGPDYYDYDYESITTTNEDGETVTTTSRNFDHFVKVVPLWQLELFCLEAGFSPSAWSDWFDDIRSTDVSDMTNGEQQINFIERFCLLSGYDFLDFFEKAGMFKATEIYVEDYTSGWIKITDDMISSTTTTVEAAGLKEAPAALNYINAYNWEVFRDEAALDTSNSVGSGCVKYSSSQIRVLNSSWPNAVGYNTYDSDGNLLHISMFGLGDSSQSDTYTYVMWDSSSSYITAVGYDGTEYVIYQAN